MTSSRQVKTLAGRFRPGLERFVFHCLKNSGSTAFTTGVNVLFTHYLSGLMRKVLRVCTWGPYCIGSKVGLNI